MTDEQIFAFVLMPFSSEFDDIYKFGIKETAKNIGIKAERVDEQIYAEGILSRIYSQIDQADLIIADMTGRKLVSYHGDARSGENNRELNLEGIEPGIYLVTLILDGKQALKKLMIE